MKAKKEGEGRWPRAIIGILMVLIMLLSLFSILTASGSDVTQTTVRNSYVVTMYNATYEEYWDLLAVSMPIMDLQFKVGEKQVSSITQGTPLGIDFTSNLDKTDCVDLVVKTPEGYELTQNPSDKNQKFNDINVSHLLEYGSENESKRINTTGWDIGTYTFSVRTEKANAGTTVNIAVEDYVDPQLKDLIIDENGEFSKEIDTANITAFSIPGSVRLKAYLDRAAGVGVIGPAETDDGSVAILVVRADLTAELSTDSVARSDDFTISGTAKGSTSVDIVVVAPKGSGGSIIDPSGTPLLTGTNIYHAATSVSDVDYTFTKKIYVGDDVDAGSYLVVVLSKGRDDNYGSGYDNLNAALATYNLTARTQEHILTILADATIDVAGSDDLMWTDHIRVIPSACLNVNISKTVVPPGESFEIYGTALSDYVELVAISPKGGNGTGLDGFFGVSVYPVPAFEGTGVIISFENYPGVPGHSFTKNSYIL
jgi:hypothetical protein